MELCEMAQTPTACPGCPGCLETFRSFTVVSCVPHAVTFQLHMYYHQHSTVAGDTALQQQSWLFPGLYLPKSRNLAALLRVTRVHTRSCLHFLSKHRSSDPATSEVVDQRSSWHHWHHWHFATLRRYMHSTPKEKSWKVVVWGLSLWLWIVVHLSSPVSGVGVLVQTTT